MGKVLADGTIVAESPANDATSANANDSLTPELKRFAGADGKVDVSKMGTSYLELERAFKETTKKLGALEQAYSVIAERVAPASEPRVTETTPESQLADLVKEPQGYIRKTVDEAVSQPAKQIVGALLEMEFPEMRDQQFIDGLNGFANTMPTAIRQQIAAGDYETRRYVIAKYKDSVKQEIAAASKEAEASESAMPHVESPTPRNQIKGAIYSRAAVKQLMRTNPAEYAKIADDVAKAYEEGRMRP